MFVERYGKGEGALPVNAIEDRCKLLDRLIHVHRRSVYNEWRKGSDIGYRVLPEFVIIDFMVIQNSIRIKIVKII